ncbi:MAG TPA: hypothetical protein EYP25_05330 [Anaerolineae bacterium]|nr:hypothetical protein [Caldilineae bacterium]HID33984.1 hypothetical protein [Anaerolineae bacterium]
MSKIDETDFQHPSEREFARLLDFYGIPWEYEPRTFPLEYNEDGSLRSAFSPDFYLPEQDLYVELTTQSPRLNRLKNKKIRRLRELYPDINVKLLNRRDIRSLAIKYDLPDPSVVNTEEGHPRDRS